MRLASLLLSACLLAACGGESETAGREDAAVGIASVEKLDPEAQKAKELAAIIAAEKPPFDAALASGDVGHRPRVPWLGAALLASR